MAFGQLFENRGFFDHALQAFERGVGAIVADQQVDAANFWEIGEQIREPNFSDEARGADEQDIFSAERGTDGKSLVARCAIRSGLRGRRLWARRVRLV